MLTNTKLTSVLLNINQRARQRPKSGSAPAAAVTVRFAEDRDNAEVSNLLWQAFSSKMTKFATTLEEFMQTVRKEDYRNERILVATKEDSGEILGTVGFSMGGSTYTTLSLWDLSKRRGIAKGVTAWFVGNLIFSGKAKSNELYVASIAVSPASRGLGVGSVLMGAMEEFAVAEGKTQLRLHVIDENPDARRLYERLGYSVVKTHTLPGPFTSILGFKKAHEMVKPLK
eukprot:TRINITY_DN14412_c0_g1_i1.p1 TRINITY_DN14412_c0_g1~~TRINITY_DN14412_c0_g1_i1.p1  ORF type:complete len:228 (-),score=22.89 TRINITY_DN14412_c0_g1_i1:23-706(-)